MMELRLMNNKRKTLFILLSLLLGLVLFFICFWIYIRITYAPSGVYLVAGGSSYLVIKPGFLGSPQIREGGLFNPNESHQIENHSVNAHYTLGKLILNQDMTLRLPYHISTGDWSSKVYTISFSLKCKPSKTAPGDWDLVKGEINAQISSETVFLSKQHRDKLFQSDSARKFMDNFSEPMRSGNLYHYNLAPPDPPVCSYLHRVNDSRMAEYFRLRLSRGASIPALQLIRKIAKDHPDDPYLKLHLVEMEILAGSPDQALRIWEEWEKKYEKSTDRLLHVTSQRVSQTLSAARLKKENPDFLHLFDVLVDPSIDMDTRIKCLKNLLQTDQMFTTGTSLIDVQKLPWESVLSESQIDLLWMFQKYVETRAIFHLFQGRREESLTLLCSLYRLGQNLSAFGTIIHRRYGFGLRDAVSGDLLFYILNACETPEELQNCRLMLDRLDKLDRNISGEYHFEDDFSRLCFFMKPGKGLLMQKMLLYQKTSRTLSDVKLDLLRVAVAAKSHYLATGDFPSSEKDLLPFFPEGFPKDPFLEGCSLSFARTSSGEFLIYSVGPDKKDDKGAVSYDPMSGFDGKGDIVIRIPRLREFPFPKEAVHSARAYELLEQFPNGLPEDPFSFSTKIPFKIIESNDNHPVVILSFGPKALISDFYPKIMDHINHTPSTLKPVPTPPPPANASRGRGSQLIMRRSEDFPPPPGCWTPEPFYDPTNGTRSNGDLFIELPR